MSAAICGARRLLRTVIVEIERHIDAAVGEVLAHLTDFPSYSAAPRPTRYGRDMGNSR